MNLHNSIVQIRCEFFFPDSHVIHLFDTEYLVLRKEVTSSVCTSVAILATVIRLFVRRSVFWFDDACALLSMLFITAHMGIIIITTKSLSSMATYYIIIGSIFYFTVWFARLSILLTIIRLGFNDRKRHLIAVAVVFLILLGLLIGQMFWVCKPQQTQSNIICTPTKEVAIFKLVSDVSADLVLLASSFRLFLIIQDKALRFRLSCLFSTCVITTAISLVNSSFILNADGLKLVIVAIVEASVSVIVANIPVLSSVFLQLGEHTRGATRSRGGVTSTVIDFVHHTDTQVSGTGLFETSSIPVGTSTMTKISSADDMT